MSDLIDRNDAIMAVKVGALSAATLFGRTDEGATALYETVNAIKALPPAQPEIVRCRDCKHNPKDTWFECPMSHLSEKQRPETAWCWKGERRIDGKVN